MKYRDAPWPALVLAATALIATACRIAPPENVALEKARETYAQAVEDPEVGRYGSYPLEEAEQYFALAQDALAVGAPTETVSQYATLADTLSLTAINIARRRAADAAVRAPSQRRASCCTP